VAAAQAKIDEKSKAVADDQTALAPQVARASQAGKVTLQAKLGQQVAAGVPVAEVSGAPAQVLRATFEATGYTAGSSCVFAAKAARDRRFACVVESVEGGKVTVRLVPSPVPGDDSPHDGDELILLPAAK